ncbi:MAG: class I SAM-dependent methyltransferase [Verrucomicrobiota bacterium]
MPDVSIESKTEEITPAFYIHSRFYFPEILNSLNLLGEGVEVGTFQGAYSAWILERWQGKKLYSVDPWKSFPREEYVSVMNNFSKEEYEKHYHEAVSMLSKYGDRSEIIRKTSEEAAPLFADASLDFVYLDGQHYYEAVRQDIASWWIKVKPLGILAGHDYVADGHNRFGIYGVKRAVNEFVRANNLSLIVSQDQPLEQFLENNTSLKTPPDDELLAPPSWFIVKPQF